MFESQGRGAESRKGKRQCNPQDHGVSGAFLWDHPEEHRARCVGWGGGRGDSRHLGCGIGDFRKYPGNQVTAARVAHPPHQLLRQEGLGLGFSIEVAGYRHKPRKLLPATRTGKGNF